MGNVKNVRSLQTIVLYNDETEVLLYTVLITHGFRVSVVSDVRDLGSPLRFMLRRSSLVE
jgi:hypothetical protein